MAEVAPEIGQPASDGDPLALVVELPGHRANATHLDLRASSRLVGGVPGGNALIGALVHEGAKFLLDIRVRIGAPEQLCAART